MRNISRYKDNLPANFGVSAFFFVELWPNKRQIDDVTL